MSLIIDTVHTYLPPKRKATPSGWVAFNAVCCHHNGTNADKRQRGGIFITPDEGVSYHCFNCGFKASWQVGRKLTPKFKKFLGWLGAPDDLITKCTFEALRTYDDPVVQHQQLLIPKFFDKALPLGSKPISQWIEEGPPDELIPVLEYMFERKLFVDDYNWHWSDEEGYTGRLIIPFYYQSRVVGYTARLIRNGKPKYLSEQQPGYVFNLDNQHDDRKYVFVFEGPIDAISIDATALMGSEIGPGQQTMLNTIHKEKVLVPDRDASSMKLVEQAKNLGWHVAFPEWDKGIKDCNDAVRKYGRLATLYSIVSTIQTSPLKIELAMKKWFKEKE